jgi:hypothetical protein
MTDETALSEHYDEPVDVAKAQETQKRNRPPAGNYVTLLEDFEPSITPAEPFEDDKERKTYSVFLRAGQRSRGGEVVEQALKFKISPDVRPARDFQTHEIKEGKDDIQSRLWAELVKAYLDYQGEDGEPLKTKGQLFEYIKNTPLVFNTMNNDQGGLTVLHISNQRRSR